MNNLTTCLYNVIYKFPEGSNNESEQTSLQDHGMVSGTSYADILTQLLSETYMEEDVLEVHLYKVPNNLMFSTSEKLWNELKRELID